MSEQQFEMTQKGYDEAKKHLQYLQTVKRQEIVERISEARSHGDLSENAEYDAAKEAQGLLEARISKLQDLVANSRLLDESKLDTSKILLLSKVKIKNTKTNKEISYEIVPESEADIKKNKISVSSPIAKALLGKKVGDVVEVNVPAGIMTFEVMSVER
jgi:transcription elongation factor GreA